MILCVSILVLVAMWQAEAADYQQNQFGYLCYKNLTQCVVDMRSILVSEDQFWFGSSYKTDCPGGTQNTSACGNPDTEHSSILSRLLNTTDNSELTQARQIISLAYVNFSSSEGQIFACGHNFHIPAVNNYQVDPLHTTQLSAWSLTRIPTISWLPANGSILYSVVVWDVGYFILHALYINCNNGSSPTGQVVKEYTGPRNPFLRGNPYVYLVYEQTTALDVDTIRQTVNSFLVQNAGRFHPGFLLTRLGSMIKNQPSFANIMTVVGDPYSVQIQKYAFVVNHCPYLISQLPVFHSVVNATNISISWSTKTTHPSLDAITPYLTTLHVNIEVEYYTDDYSTESCCSIYSLTRGLFRVDPFNVNTERPGMARLTPKVHFSPVEIASRIGIAGETYTLFMLDVAAALIPGVQNPLFITHWIVTNIQNADISTGDELAAYFGPNPFAANISRPYMFLLVKQPVRKLNNSVLAEFCPTGGQRCRLQLKPVLDAWNLHEIVGLTWFQAEQDGFARYRIYDVLKARNKSEVCKDLPGYTEPCLAQCHNNVPRPRTGSGKLLAILATFILFFVELR